MIMEFFLLIMVIIDSFILMDILKILMGGIDILMEEE